MTYINTSTRTTKPTSTENFQTIGRSTSLSGVFLGFIKDSADVQRNGRLRVWIPEFGSAPDNEDGWTIVNYCSPFAGATNVNSISKTDTHNFDQTQTSYGMWMIPPDIDNEVLVLFINGDSSRGVWIGCMYNQYMNNMIPGMASDARNWNYPGKVIPVAEYNKWDNVVAPDRTFKPYEKTKFKGIGNQGLLVDPNRGTTTSGARREAPSAVFGIITPGPVINNVDVDISKNPGLIRRKGGSSFIMDDGDDTEYVQLVTKTGAQIRLDETNGFVYLINRDGTAWIQMDYKGNIDIFSAINISLRGQADVNIRADRNVNIEAGQNIYMKAAADTKLDRTAFEYDTNNKPITKKIPVYKYKKGGVGGNIIMQAVNDWDCNAGGSAYLTSGSSTHIHAGGDFNATSGGDQNFLSGQGIKLDAAAAIDILSAGSIRETSGSKLSVTAADGIVICSPSGLNLNSDDGINFSTPEAKFSQSVSIVSDLTVMGSGHLNADYAALAGFFGFPSAHPVIPPIPEYPDQALDASGAAVAAVPPTVSKINILARWDTSLKFPKWQANTAYKAGDIVTNDDLNSDGTVDEDYIYKAPPGGVAAKPTFDENDWLLFIPEDKFKRRAQPFKTINTRLPTYEPCPEHDNFKFDSISGYSPPPTGASTTYPGSSGPGSPATTSPPGVDDLGSDATDTDASSSTLTKDFNMAAYQCQLKINEGVKYTSYYDSKGLPTAGIGHLLRTDEIATYPVPTAVTEAQVNTWFQSDALVSIGGAQRLLGTDVWSNLTDIRKRACADLCYNLGETGLSKFKNFLAAMKAGDYNAAGAALKDSAWFGQVGRRGPRIVSMIVQNVDPNGCDKKFPG